MVDCVAWCKTHLFPFLREWHQSQVKLWDVTLHNENHNSTAFLSPDPRRCWETAERQLLSLRVAVRKFDRLFSDLMREDNVHSQLAVILGIYYHKGRDNILQHQNLCHWVVLMQKVIHRSITSLYFLRMSSIVWQMKEACCLSFLLENQQSCSLDKGNYTPLLVPLSVLRWN